MHGESAWSTHSCGFWLGCRGIGQLVARELHFTASPSFNCQADKRHLAHVPIQPTELLLLLVLLNCSPASSLSKLVTSHFSEPTCIIWRCCGASPTPETACRKIGSVRSDGTMLPHGLQHLLFPVDEDALCSGCGRTGTARREYEREPGSLL